VAAVTAGRAAARDELFAAEGHAAITAVAGFDSDVGFVDEHWDGERSSAAFLSRLLPLDEFSGGGSNGLVPGLSDRTMIGRFRL
jgi:hypothetical protein